MTRDSFVFLGRYIKSFAKLNMEERGILITAMMNYQIGEDLPEMDSITDMAFSFIKDDMDFNNEKYDKKCEQNRINGKKGGRPKANGFSENPQKANGYFGLLDENPNKPTETLSESESESDYESDKEKEKEQKKKFVKPSVDEVRAYCTERGNGIDPESFVDFYESKGWKVGNNPMKDWKAAVRTWEKRESKVEPRPANKASPTSDIPKTVYDKIHNYPERQRDYKALAKEIWGIDE